MSVNIISSRSGHCFSCS